jgi:hypothetical protein
VCRASLPKKAANQCIDIIYCTNFRAGRAGEIAALGAKNDNGPVLKICAIIAYQMSKREIHAPRHAFSTASGRGDVRAHPGEASPVKGFADDLPMIFILPPSGESHFARANGVIGLRASYDGASGTAKHIR